MEFLDGYKSYVIGLASIALGVYMISIGETSNGTLLIAFGMSTMGLRDAINKK